MKNKSFLSYQEYEVLINPFKYLKGLRSVK